MGCETLGLCSLMVVVREEVNRSKEGFCREECHSGPTNYVAPSPLGEGSRLSHVNEKLHL